MLEWNVYYHDFNKDKIELYNVFEHYRFYEELQVLLKESDKQIFSEKLERLVQYYFWSKAQWEVLIFPWIGNKNKPVKIDVYNQLKNNWQIFVNYIWENRKQD